MKILKPELVVDISKWDYEINTKELEDGGVKAVIVRMGSNQNLDPNFIKHAENISKSTLILMAYHWDDIIYSAENQATWAVKTIKSLGYPVKFLWGDLEQYWINWSLKTPGNPDTISSHMKRYSETMKSLYPNFGIYTGKGFTDSWCPKSSEWIGAYNIWHAQWGIPLPTKDMEWKELKQKWLPNYDLSLSTGVNPLIVSGHQFTGDRVRMRGIYNQYGIWLRTDVSVFNQDFLKYINTGDIPIPPTPIPPTPTTKEYMVTSYKLNVRPTPDTSGTPIKVLNYGDRIQVINITGGWAALASGGYVVTTYIKLVT
jgi:hypothetical protein